MPPQTENTSYPYQAYTNTNIHQLPTLDYLTRDQIEAIEIVGSILPFKTNSYVIRELINWDNIPNDPIFTLTFPRKEMLKRHHYEHLLQLKKSGANSEIYQQAVHAIRSELNPHPAGQLTHNIPEVEGEKLTGVQHKYRQTVLFFPSHGQTCHAYCTFCFRWPQFVGMDELKFASKEIELLVSYLKIHTEVTDILFTGGDPMIMRTKWLSKYILPIISDELPHIQTIRIGTKALGYWPYRFTTDNDADELMTLFEKITGAGKNLAIMAHFNHPIELSTPAVQLAIKRIRQTGAQIRSQSPVMKHINDSPAIWSDMWRKQVNLGIIPYYMFLARDTGAQHFFAVPLVDAWTIFRKAYQSVSGVCRTVRGPSMSCSPGKVQLLGVSELMGTQVMVFRFLQGRNPDWIARPFFAEFNPHATWIDDLKPAFGEKEFFFEAEYAELFHEKSTQSHSEDFE